MTGEVPATSEQSDAKSLLEGFTLIEGRIGRVGALVDVKLDITLAEHERRRGEGGIAAPVVHTKGLIDTGAERSVVHPPLLANLMLVDPLRHVALHTVNSADPEPAEIHGVRMTLGPPGEQASPFELPAVRADVHHASVGIGCLIGRDVLARAILIWLPNGYFNLFLPK